MIETLSGIFERCFATGRAYNEDLVESAGLASDFPIRTVECELRLTI
jgi:hypothetical protein